MKLPWIKRKTHESQVEELSSEIDKLCDENRTLEKRLALMRLGPCVFDDVQVTESKYAPTDPHHYCSLIVWNTTELLHQKHAEQVALFVRQKILQSTDPAMLMEVMLDHQDMKFKR